WLVRRVSQKTPDFGVIVIDLGKVPPDAAAEVHQRVNDVLSDAADTLERLDVAHALHQAKMRSETELLREALIGSVSHELRAALERRRRRLNGHATSLDVDSNLPFVYVDPVLIEQAFSQVVDNAGKYSPPGSTITVAAKRNGHGLVLSVHDDGVGLSKEESAQ